MRATDYHFTPMNTYGRYSPSSVALDSSFIDGPSKFSHNAAYHSDDGLTDHHSEESSLGDHKMFHDHHSHGFGRYHDIPRVPSNDDHSGEHSLSLNDSFQDSRPSNHTQHAFKCRQLPCRTFISTGACPYGDRCVFLHDPCIMSKPVFVKSKQRKSKEDAGTDVFFWPTMPLNSVMGKLDHKNSKFEYHIKYFQVICINIDISFFSASYCSTLCRSSSKQLCSNFQ